MLSIRQRFQQSVAIIGATLLFSQTVVAAGLMVPKGGNLPALDIKQHHVNVVIEDGYAITTVDQVFYNPHNNELEAKYSFPVPDKASVGK